MNRIQEPEHLALVLAGAGIALAALIMLPLGITVVPEFAAQISLGVAIVLASTYGLGRTLPRFVGEDTWSSMAVGTAFAGTTLTLGALGGSALSLLVERDPFGFGAGEAVIDWIFKPVFWVLFVGGLPVVILGSIWGRWVRRRFAVPESRGPKRRAAGIATAVILSPIAFVLLTTGHEHQVTHTMRWGFPSAVDETASRVTLVFVDYPHYFQTFESPELVDYLRAHGPEIDVTYSVTSDFGSPRGIGIDAIGDFEGDVGWRGGGQGCGQDLLAPCDDGERKSPWE